MDEFVRVAGGLLLSIGCENTKVDRSATPGVKFVTATFRGSNITVRVSQNEKWGRDEACGSLRWSDDRYPMSFISIPDHVVTGDRRSHQTHHLIVGGSLDRAVILPERMVLTSPIGTDFTLGGGAVVRRVPCWGEKVVFFRRRDGWAVDRGNVWKAPVAVSMDPDEYLQSLG